jgi:hypothetical protein
MKQNRCISARVRASLADILRAKPQFTRYTLTSRNTGQSKTLDFHTIAGVADFSMVSDKVIFNILPEQVEGGTYDFNLTFRNTGKSSERTGMISTTRTMSDTMRLTTQRFI